MKKFVFLYNVGTEDENTDEHSELWMNWFHAIGKSVVDMGNPLVNGVDVRGRKVSEVTLEMGIASGYSIINAANMEAAIEIAHGCPGKNGLQIYESVPM